MVYRNLAELEAVMYGHEVPFYQSKQISGDDSFNRQFRSWLSDRFDVSASGGWALAIENLAKREGVETKGGVHDRLDDREMDAYFAGLMTDFLSEWLGEKNSA